MARQNQVVSMPGRANPRCWGVSFLRSFWIVWQLRRGAVCNACGQGQTRSVDISLSWISAQAQWIRPNWKENLYALSRRLHPDVFGRLTTETRLEPGNKFHAQDAYRTLERCDQAHRVLCALEGSMEEQSKQRRKNAALTENETQVVPPDLWRRFRTQHELEEMRARKKIGEDDPVCLRTSARPN